VQLELSEEFRRARQWTRLAEAVRGILETAVRQPPE
jgi:hypothetical protein